MHYILLKEGNFAVDDSTKNVKAGIEKYYKGKAHTVFPLCISVLCLYSDIHIFPAYFILSNTNKNLIDMNDDEEKLKKAKQKVLQREKNSLSKNS